MIEYTVKVNDDGDKEWFLNDKLHREDGPACEYVSGTKLWYSNHKLHREDGPACEWANGSRFWYLNGKLHRADGPAIERVNGDKAWHLNGKQVTEAQHAEQTAPVIEMTIEEICKALGKKVKVVK